MFLSRAVFLKQVGKRLKEMDSYRRAHKWNSGVKYPFDLNSTNRIFAKHKPFHQSWGYSYTSP